MRSNYEDLERDVGPPALAEECWVLIGRVTAAGKWRALRAKYSVGRPTSVAFDANWVMNRAIGRGDILGFVHTHPSSLAAPSCVDYATMQAWSFALGRPLLCAIDGTDGLRAHWFVDEKTPHVEGSIHRWRSFYWGRSNPSRLGFR